MVFIQLVSALKLREGLEYFGSLAILPAVKLVKHQSLERKVRNFSTLKMMILLLLRILQVVKDQVGLNKHEDQLKTLEDTPEPNEPFRGHNEESHLKASDDNPKILKICENDPKYSEDN